MGPIDNRSLLNAYPGGRPYMLTPDPTGIPVYEPYDAAIARIWGADVYRVWPGISSV